MTVPVVSEVQEIRVSRADVQRAYGAYVSQGYGDTDGYYAPLSFDHWTSSVRRWIRPYLERVLAGERFSVVLADWTNASKWDRPAQMLGELVLERGRS